MSKLWRFGPLLALAVCGLSCTAGPAETAIADGPAPQATAPARTGGARTLPLPGAPPNHPPVDGARPGRLVWSLPEDWVEEQPASRMRLAQYRVPGPSGEAQCVVYYFGPGQGGDAESNARRWAGQFAQPDGRPSVETMQFGDLDDGAVGLSMVEVTGTYDGGMTMTAEPAQPMPGYMLLGGIAEGPDAPWFFKLTGPEATVRSQRDAFVRMLRSVREAS